MSAAEKKRILFVDDEPNVLQGLRDSLRKVRSRWDMTFEQYPKQAAALLERERFDVIVSDMRMPEMDGATLLSKVRETHPEAVRIVLSGFTELEVAIRAVSVAHQFLTKPCEAGYLEKTVERACEVQSLLGSTELRALVGNMETLPTTPHIFAQVTEVMTKTQTTAAAVAKVIEQDPAMCAKLLQMSNGGFFRLARPITRVEDAIVYLGFSMIKNLVLSTEVFSKTLTKGMKRSKLRAIQEHSRLAAHLAVELAPDKYVKEDAFLAAILHDVGRIVLASSHDDYPANVESMMTTEKISYQEAEKRLYSVTHAEVGAYLLGLWGVPFNVVEAVAYHHRPLTTEPGETVELETISVVALAVALSEEALSRGPDNDNTSPTELVERLGIQDRLAELRAHAKTGAKKVKMGS